MSPIMRITLFKLPDQGAVQEAIEKYSALSQAALKDGKPYIQMAAANAPHEDPRSQGYTLVARTVFASKADMDYYDNECEAHAGIKALLRPKVEAPPLVVYMDA
jgi:hypothetical protein